MMDYWISFATSLDPNDGLGSQRKPRSLRDLSWELTVAFCFCRRSDVVKVHVTEQCWYHLPKNHDDGSPSLISRFLWNLMELVRNSFQIPIGRDKLLSSAVILSYGVDDRLSVENLILQGLSLLTWLILMIQSIVKLWFLPTRTTTLFLTRI